MKYFVLPCLAMLNTHRTIVATPQFPLPGPVQHCRDDAGPPYGDDGVRHYSHYSSASPILVGETGNECPAPLKGACKTKSPKVAFLDGPINCGGKGWFCRISPQKGWTEHGVMMGDSNFMHCNETGDRDTDGHCHGGHSDDVYGWWTRDHWHRDYKGHLTCCCGLDLMVGLIDRCDYRIRINTTKQQENCRDANEEHNVDWSYGCPNGNPNPNFIDPAVDPATKDQCWELKSFGLPMEKSENDKPQGKDSHSEENEGEDNHSKTNMEVDSETNIERENNHSGINLGKPTEEIDSEKNIENTESAGSDQHSTSAYFILLLTYIIYSYNDLP